jgi:hypothetical protein
MGSIKMRKYLSKDTLNKIDKMFWKVRSPQIIREKLTTILEKSGFDYLDMGTNRIIFTHPKADNVVFKFGYDKQGKLDNLQEFKIADTYKYFAKSYECDEEGYCLVQECCPHISWDDAQKGGKWHKKMISILEELEPDFLLEDVGCHVPKNWGIDKKGNLKIIDFGYVLELEEVALNKYCQEIVNVNKIIEGKRDGKSSVKPKYCGGKLHYNKDFSKVVCDKCDKKYMVAELRHLKMATSEYMNSLVCTDASLTQEEIDVLEQKINISYDNRKREVDRNEFTLKKYVRDTMSETSDSEDISMFIELDMCGEDEEETIKNNPTQPSAEILNKDGVNNMSKKMYDASRQEVKAGVRRVSTKFYGAGVFDLNIGDSTILDNKGSDDELMVSFLGKTQGDNRQYLTDIIKYLLENTELTTIDILDITRSAIGAPSAPSKTYQEKIKEQTASMLSAINKCNDNEVQDITIDEKDKIVVTNIEFGEPSSFSAPEQAERTNYAKAAEAELNDVLNNCDKGRKVNKSAFGSENKSNKEVREMSKKQKKEEKQRKKADRNRVSAFGGVIPQEYDNEEVNCSSKVVKADKCGGDCDSCGKVDQCKDEHTNYYDQAAKEIETHASIEHHPIDDINVGDFQCCENCSICAHTTICAEYDPKSGKDLLGEDEQFVKPGEYDAKDTDISADENRIEIADEDCFGDCTNCEHSAICIDYDPDYNPNTDCEVGSIAAYDCDGHEHDEHNDIHHINLFEGTIRDNEKCPTINVKYDNGAQIIIYPEMFPMLYDGLEANETYTLANASIYNKDEHWTTVFEEENCAEDNAILNLIEEVTEAELLTKEEILALITAAATKKQQSTIKAQQNTRPGVKVVVNK